MFNKIRSFNTFEKAILPKDRRTCPARHIYSCIDVQNLILKSQFLMEFHELYDDSHMIFTYSGSSTSSL
jgi:hypothetical protein